MLNEDEKASLARQDTRMVDDFKAKKFVSESKKHWDIFYKRNTTKFFKDRHWTTREFSDLCCAGPKVLLEVGCGVGNFVFPLIEDPELKDIFIFACDFSPRAVQMVKENPLYQEVIFMFFYY